MEFKKAPGASEKQLEETAQSAIHQIEQKRYDQELLRRKVSKILYLGFAFSGKKVLIHHKFKD